MYGRSTPIPPQLSLIQLLKKELPGFAFPGGGNAGDIFPGICGLGGLFALEGGVGVVNSLMAALLSRRLKILNLLPVLLSSLRTTAMALIIIVGGTLFGDVVTILHVPQLRITFLGELEVGPWQFIILVILFPQLSFWLPFMGMASRPAGL